MRAIYLIMLLLCTQAAEAHQPELSSLMIYEQNGKPILLIKSSLSAFEGEIGHYFKKGAYKSAEEFKQLVIKHFQKNCIITANGDTINFANIQLQLGHETTLFAELDNMPGTIGSMSVKNTLFRDMPNNQCELILSIKGLPQKQYILNNGNQQEVTLKAQNNEWAVAEAGKAFFLHSTFLIGLGGSLIISLIIIALLKRKGRLAR